jgi:hypothetical protein
LSASKEVMEPGVTSRLGDFWSDILNDYHILLTSTIWKHWFLDVSKTTQTLPMRSEDGPHGWGEEMLNIFLSLFLISLTPISIYICSRVLYYYYASFPKFTNKMYRHIV